MRFPIIRFADPDAGISLNRVAWRALTDKAELLNAGVGRSVAFEEAIADLLSMVANRRFEGIKAKLKRRVFARALTQLWLEDRDFRHTTLTGSLLEALVSSQGGGLGLLTLYNLIALYFQEFDHLSQYKGRAAPSSLLEELSTCILAQVVESKGPKNDDSNVLLQNLREKGHELLNLNGPNRIVNSAKYQNLELEVYLQRLGLADFISGRYADVCRSLYYLETLRTIPLGAHTKVFNELLKPTVYSALYSDSLTIGLAALEIIIDRSHTYPGQNWQNFVIDLAGDPRIANRSMGFKDWWEPLGEFRQARVKSWLAKEDLSLFLRAVEQYGLSSGDAALQRMFPARKRFLEGLLEQGVVKSARLMLGADAKSSVLQFIDKKLIDANVALDGGMSDKAVIYLNCGKFHIIEGSHNFKIWVYLSQPSELLMNYSVRSLTYSQLIHTIPEQYTKSYPGRAMFSVRHQGEWQSKVILFLHREGVNVDVEKLLTPAAYRLFLSRHGVLS